MPEPTTRSTYIAAVRAALSDMPAKSRDELVAELEANLAADIERRGGNPAAELAAIEDLGSPEEYAAAVREAFSDDVSVAIPQGRLLGMPYEFRAPTAESVMLRMWNPADPRIFVPRTWGMGWTINFGAVAVRLGLARPDDVEERPFENVSPMLLATTIAIPLGIAVVAVVLVAAYWTRLPAQVPIHFDNAGAGDDWAAKGITFALLLGISSLMPAVTLALARIRHASRGTLIVTSVFITFLCLLATVMIGYTIANTVYGVEGWWIGLLIIGSLLVPGGMFYVLARASIKHEWTHALSEKESR